MKILILTSPAGAGKNTVAKIIALKRTKCAVVDVDNVRQMLLHPHKAPWAGEEGKQQQILGVENACILAENFIKNNCDVLIIDMLSNETAGLYRKLLEEYMPKIVLLLPSLEEVRKRNTMRPQMITDEEIRMLYRSQQTLEGFDQRIDTTELSAEETAERLNLLMS